MTETLNSHSTVVLFGKIVEDLKVVPEKKGSGKEQAIARIYGYSFGGAYYEMASPVLFAVEGKGDAADKTEVPGPGLDDDDPFYKSLRCWSFDKSDKTIRMDLDSGTFEQVLLGDSGDGGMGVSGARVSGARVSGARVSGARVSGARISGARLSGARGDASD
ncbi:MAG: pentapeptide repeat-containing protein [Roseibium sp.]|uniref:pentapeptide repeat-containing protein n=1 Tax=Roseibium sp. TaxID=1936156 RepID=UPI001B03BCC2|nr:pentapeptide repeat-containing protein [Roseibium sp.]MBO6892033.1 pentapeptide repeat-containing protein [Roseibium sp.]MBO6929316.1 pentapeptide repeat-containing protein [Roseibium sp.]